MCTNAQITTTIPLSFDSWVWESASWALSAGFYCNLISAPQITSVVLLTTGDSKFFTFRPEKWGYCTTQSKKWGYRYPSYPRKLRLCLSNYMMTSNSSDACLKSLKLQAETSEQYEHQLTMFYRPIILHKRPNYFVTLLLVVSTKSLILKMIRMLLDANISKKTYFIFGFIEMLRPCICSSNLYIVVH